ncbi:MAG: anthranilate phosphoribosyltransferase [Chloroflexi bacterium]|nr:anthranilate phosphoribosyltransferase [Chloroflexota bacterium]
MGIREALAKVVENINLSEEEATAAMEDIVAGNATPAQIAAFAVALRMKGETIDEMVGLARVMRDASLKIVLDEPLLDTCGTGGDGSGTFNISTTAAIVAAAAGARVAKHGNRAVTSQSGSADLLGALGIVPDLPPLQATQCIVETGIGFLFAPAYHPAMASAAGPRREIGVRTVFNVLGPLSNPARARHQLLGVAVSSLAPKMAEVLLRMGSKHALVVHGSDGLDEITLTGPTEVHEVKDGTVRNWTLDPTDYGFNLVPPGALLGGDPIHNAGIAHTVFAAEPSPFRDVVELNAGAALFAADVVSSLKAGIDLARKVIEDGTAGRKLDQVIATSQRLKPAAP